MVATYVCVCLRERETLPYIKPLNKSQLCDTTCNRCLPTKEQECYHKLQVTFSGRCFGIVCVLAQHFDICFALCNE